MNRRGDADAFLVFVVGFACIVGFIFLLSHVHLHHKKKAFRMKRCSNCMQALGFPPVHPGEDWWFYAFDGAPSAPPPSGGNWARGPAPKEEEIAEEEDVAIENFEAPEGIDSDTASVDSGSSDGGSDGGGDGGGGGD